MSNSEERGARVRFPPPLVFVAAMLAGVALRYAVSPAPVPVARTLGVLGGSLLLAMGVGLIVSARLLFTRTGQSPIPWKPTPTLISRGPFRFTRNPMYLGMTLNIVGLSLLLDNLWIALFAAPALLTVHFIAVRPEERYLSEKFGDSYKRYIEQVRRYL